MESIKQQPQEHPVQQIEASQSLGDVNYQHKIENGDLAAIEKQSEILDWFLKLQSGMTAKTSECELLKIKLDESNRSVETLSNELNACKLAIFQNNEDSKNIHEEVMRSKKLEEDYIKLMGDYLNLTERYEQHRQTLYDTYLAKTNAINNYECLMSREAIKHELDSCKAELHSRQAESAVLAAKLRNMDEENSVKEKCITELKKSLDDAKVTHKHEITVLEEYIQCLKNTITSYEKTLANYIEHDENRNGNDSGGQPDGDHVDQTSTQSIDDS